MLKNIEITKREIIASIAITAIMITIGLFISRSIDQTNLESAKKYDTAIKIDNNTDLFQHCMNTNAGRSFIYGDMIALDTVTYPEIGGEYMYVRKIKEEWKIVRYEKIYDDNGKVIDEKPVWDWVEVYRDSIHCEKIEFCGLTFDYDLINTPGASYITTQYENWRDVRYIYYGEETRHTGTLYTHLQDGTISQKNRFYDDCNIGETIQILKNNDKVTKFLVWFLWIILTVAVNVGFFALENNYLEDFKRG